MSTQNREQKAPAIRSQIACAASYLPARAVSNTELSHMVDTNDEWIVSRTGISSRFVSTGENTSAFGLAVCERLLKKTGLPASDIDLILVATITPDYDTPSVACMIQGALGASNAIAFDINAACSGFLYGLSIADKMIRMGQCCNAIVIGAEVLSKVVDWADRATCVLFGDGAGGVLLTAGEGSGILAEKLRADGTRAMAIHGGHRPVQSAFTQGEQDGRYLQMNGREIFDFATREVPRCIAEMLAAAGVSKDEVQWIVPHQANERIMQVVARKLGISFSRFYVNIARVGNTSSASIPIALAELLDSGQAAVGSGEMLVLAGFGGGLTWGSMLIQL